MNYHKIDKCSVSNGTGCRIVLWLSGCHHHCKECHNPETWDENSGIEFDTVAKKELINALKPDYIAGLTLSGGDPMFLNNRDEATQLAKEIKELYPNKNIWMYTGYTFEEIKNLEILNYIDVIVDGEFEINKKDISLKFRGSKNQNIWVKEDNEWSIRKE